jgi:hypothetical protein
MMDTTGNARRRPFLAGLLSVLLVCMGLVTAAGTPRTALAAPVPGNSPGIGSGLHLNSPGVPRALRAAVRKRLKPHAVLQTTSPLSRYSQSAEFNVSNVPAGTDTGFGYAVAISADSNTALIGAPYTNASGVSTGAAYVYTKSGGGWSQTATLTDPTSYNGHAGTAVALSADGTTALVGDPRSDVYGFGAVAVFTLSGGTWSLLTDFSPSVCGLSCGFGSALSVSADGQTAVIGAPGGAKAYVYADTGGTWNQSAMFSGGSGFGTAVALSSTGTTALVGAPGAGTATLFSSSSGSWTQSTALTASGSGSFGDAVALSSDGTTALVGAGTTNSGTGAAYVFNQSDGSWSQSASLTASDGQTGDNFGASVALSADGTGALIGADHRNSSTGAAYMFGVSGGSWTQGATLTSNDGQTGDLFGCAVALSPDAATPLVGASGETRPVLIYTSSGPQNVPTNMGGAYLFAPVPANELLASDGRTGDYFGDSVALSADGSTALVGAGASAGDVRLAGPGSAYIFTRSGGSWTQTAELAPSDRTSTDGFGWSVALSADGTTAVVGAPRHNNFTGAVYVFHQSAGAWSQSAEISGTSGSNFGHSVAASSDGSALLIGAPGANAAYVYTESGGTWSLSGTLSSDATQHFGYSVALSGDGTTALIGEDDGDFEGFAYIFTKTAGGWTQTSRLRDPNSNINSNDLFGTAVALSADGGTALVGATVDNLNSTGSFFVGEAFVYTHTADGWPETAALTPSNVQGGYFGKSVALSADGSVAVIGYGQVGDYGGAVPGPGAADLFTLAAGTWSQVNEFTAPDTTTGDSLGYSVALSADGSIALAGAPNRGGGLGAAYGFALTPRIGTSTTVTGTPNPSRVGQQVTYTATVSPAPTGGTVEVQDDGSDIAGCTSLSPDSSGQVTCQVTYNAIGNHTIQAFYSGSSTDDPSHSAPLTQQSTCAATATSCTFTYSGREEVFLVPSGVTSVTVTAVGAPGGSDTSAGGGGAGGKGASVTATVPVPAGTTRLYVEVGGAGEYPGMGGFNGGGGVPADFNKGGGLGGGGASDVRTTSITQVPDTLLTLANDSRLVVAGGGGAAGGGQGCLANGGQAGDATVSGAGAAGGSPPLAGGNGGFGAPAGDGVDGGTSGDLGVGGGPPVPSNPTTRPIGNGGGGGYYGGGGAGEAIALCGGVYSGAVFRGGGAGSSYWVDGATHTSMAEDTTGVPEVIISYRAPTTTTLTSSANPSVFGQSVTFTATVAGPQGSATPTGSVQFSIDGKDVGGAVTLDGNDQATYTTSALAVTNGTNHTVTASYAGDDSFLASSGSLSGGQEVDRADTTVSLSSSANPSVLGQSVNITAAVAAKDPGSGTPGGTVTFKDGTATLGTGTLSGGTATVTTSGLTVGAHSITASYSGDGNFNSSAGSGLSQQVRYTVTVLSTSDLMIELQLKNYGDANVSASSIPVTAECVVAYGQTAPPTCGAAPIQTIKSGAFAFNRNWQGKGGANQFQVSGQNLTKGQAYYLLVQTGGDPIWHAVQFTR